MHVPGFCDDCGSPVVWSTTRAGKQMMVDKHTSTEGRLVYRGGRVHQLSVAELGELDPDVPRYSPHVASCRKKVKSGA
jgi:hypothetical protein